MNLRIYLYRGRISDTKLQILCFPSHSLELYDEFLAAYSHHKGEPPAESFTQALPGRTPYIGVYTATTRGSSLLRGLYSPHQGELTSQGVTQVPQGETHCTGVFTATTKGNSLHREIHNQRQCELTAMGFLQLTLTSIVNLYTVSSP